MAQSLFDQRQIDVAGHQLRAKSEIQAMRVPLLNRQSSGFSNRLEDPGELSPVQPAALLRREDKS